jgi:hypothetical protein
MNRRELLGGLLIAPTAAAAASPVAPSPSLLSGPLSGRAADNLTAFARLAAYVRFFHPSDAAAGADWNRFVVSNIEAIETARTPAELVQRLDDAFRPIAPTLKLYAAATPPIAKPDPGPGSGSLVMWKHQGVALTSPSIYSGARVPVADGQPKALPLVLGGGVSAIMPTTAQGQTTTLTAPTMAAAATDARTYSPDDRRVRLAAVIIAWGVLQHFYPYFDIAGGDWNAELSKGLRGAAQDRDGQAFEHTLARMIAALRDGHGNVYFQPPKTALPLGWSWIEDRLVITATPADAAGLAVGGVVTRIDGVEVRQRLAALDPEISAATPQWLRFKSLQLLQQRPDGTPATLEGEAPDGRPFKASLAPAPWAAVSAVTLSTARENFSEPRPGVIYVDLGRVTDLDLTTRMDTLAAAKGIVFDGRGYPSGAARKLLCHLADRPLRSARFEIPTVVSPDRQDMAFGRGGWVIPPEAPRFPARLVLLTGGGSISYAESWAGTFEGEGLGPIVGGATAGTNGNINRLWLPGGYQVVFTGMRVTKQDGSRHHGVGIVPTVPVAPTLAGVRAGRDEVLERGAALAAGEA